MHSLSLRIVDRPVSKNSGAGSAVVFDYLPPGIEDGTTALKAGRALHNWAKRRGEPFQFGTDEVGVRQLLSDRGFDKITCTPAKDCRRLYFSGANEKREISALFSFAVASVNARR